MSFEAFAPLMFAGLVGTLLIGFPVAFSLAALGLLCGLIAIEMGIFPVAFMGNLPLNVLGILSNDLLLASPLSIRVTTTSTSTAGRSWSTLPETASTPTERSR